MLNEYLAYLSSSSYNNPVLVLIDRKTIDLDSNKLGWEACHDFGTSTC